MYFTPCQYRSNFTVIRAHEEEKVSRQAPTSRSVFWNPEFRIEHREDGTILMEQVEPLGPYPETTNLCLLRWASERPGQTFLARRRNGGDWRRLSYREVLDKVRSIGSFLLDAGVTPERPVMILSENSLEHALMALAAQYVGIPSAAISPAYSLVSTDHEKLRNLVRDLDPGLIFADDGDKFAAAFSAVAKPDMRLVVVANPPKGREVHLYSEVESFPASDAADEACRAVNPDTVVKYLFTSGSTGSPKGVINTQRMITSNQAMIADCYRFPDDQPPVVVDWAPWNHTASGNKVFYMVLYHGGTFYIDDGKPTPDGIKETIRNLKEISPSWYFNVPVGYDMLVKAFEKDAELCRNFFRNLKMMMYAGAGMAQHTWDSLTELARSTTGHDIMLATGLGATETAPFALMCTEFQKKAGNVGVPSRGLILKLVPNDDKLEARLKGPSITPGYLHDEEQTRKAFDEEGFYRLGDALRPADPDDLTKGFFFDGRIAENFKLSTGTWVAVGTLRAHFIDHFGGLVKDVVIVGEDRDYLTALVFPHEQHCRELSPDHFEGKGLDEVLASSLVRAALADRLKSLASEATGSSNRIRSMLALAEPPELDKGEVTDKGSINQRAVKRNRPQAVEALYSGAPGVISI